MGLERQAPAHVVYQPEHHECPWAGCHFRIAGINFRLDLLGDGARQAQWLSAWWVGPGLLARCPGCQRYVLFGLNEKRPVNDPAATGLPVLPDDWHQTAFIA